MRDAPATVDYAGIVFFNDESTPWDFVIELLVTVFNKSSEDAADFATEVHKRGQLAAGPYPPEVAKALFEAATRFVQQRGQALRLQLVDPGDKQTATCSFCGKASPPGHGHYRGKSAVICGECLLLGASGLAAGTGTRRFHYAHQALT